MAKIHQLSPEIIAKIAAGEVIERPAYAIKELIENAIDAKASFIKVELDKAGLAKIIISDNGSGMTKEDLFECFKPHTTSKIQTEDDLFSVTSMGFRGEALSSLATISEMTIRSRYESESIGTEIVLVNGEIEKNSPFGMPKGTEIIIRNLFNATPARKKFINNPAVEFKLITELLTGISLAVPEVGFSLIHNSKKILEFPQNQSLFERARSILGQQATGNLITLQGEDSYVTIKGFIAKPQFSSNSGNRQFMFVNRRKILDRQLSAIIKEAYGTLLEPKTQPIFILFIDLPSERVDVNVHPRKEQVAFTDQSLINKTIKQAIVEVLSKENLIYNDRRWQKGEYAPTTFPQWSLRDGDTRSYAGQLLKETTVPWTVQTETLKSSDIIQMHNLYLITQSNSGMVIIDQHAAHERILYEQFLNDFQKLKERQHIYILPTAITLHVSVLEQVVIVDNLKVFNDLGFDIDIETSTIHAVPELFKDRNIPELIKELVEDISEGRELKDIDTKSHKMLAYLACRTAIKAGDALSKEEAKNLIQKLSQCSNKYTCPHGRPIQIIMSLNELHHQFHRR
jgi:DNA mismatch repair protein MutL